MAGINETQSAPQAASSTPASAPATPPVRKWYVITSGRFGRYEGDDLREMKVYNVDDKVLLTRAEAATLRGKVERLGKERLPVVDDFDLEFGGGGGSEDTEIEVKVRKPKQQ